MRHQVKEGLQGETLYFEVQFTLAQLNPLCKDIVVIVDFVCQFADICETLLSVGSIEIVQTTDFMNDTVDERRNTIDERNFGTLLQMTSFIVFKA